jgi:hypothetical protein
MLWLSFSFVQNRETFNDIGKNKKVIKGYKKKKKLALFNQNITSFRIVLLRVHFNI